MLLKAALVCDDVRVEIDRALTIVGVRSDEVRGTLLDGGAIAFPRLLFVTIVGGLRGQASVDVRHRMIGSGARERAMRTEVHDPEADDHVFLFGDVPMVFPAAGTYEVVTEIVVGSEELYARTAVRVSAR
ncbi:MAG: hypothetical protein NT062_33745 [Proteobacteria bacterium]|nr:hypothetical protein [Pseudomonadota bacterium]